MVSTQSTTAKTDSSISGAAALQTPEETNLKRPSLMEHPTTRADTNQGGNHTGLGADVGSVQPVAAAANGPAESGESGDCGLVRPWMCFWPPDFGSAAYKKLEAENPDVLTWRFDIARPFDRPWRLWTDPALAEGGGNPVVLNGLSNISHQTPYQPSRGLPQATQRIRQALDAEVRGLNLPTVQPKSFHHLAPDKLYQTHKPYKCQLPKNCFAGFDMHNLQSKSYRVSIANIAGHEDRFSLAVSGFEFAKCTIAVSSWSDANVSSEYLPGLVNWLKERLGCHDVFCYAYNFRHHDTSQKSEGHKYEFKPPFLRAHCDATEATCQARLQLYFPDSYKEMMQGRVRFINVWRPISPAPVEDCPLALCDFRTVNREDLVPMDIVYPHFIDEAYEVKHNPSHRWFYKKGMTQEDAIVFKLYDSLRSEATVCPHSAFVDPSAPLDTPRRASIEVKAIVLG